MPALKLKNVKSVRDFYLLTKTAFSIQLIWKQYSTVSKESYRKDKNWFNKSNSGANNAGVQCLCTRRDNSCNMIWKNLFKAAITNNDSNMGFAYMSESKT